MLMDFDSFDREQERLKKEQEAREALEREQAKLKESTASPAKAEVKSQDADKSGAGAVNTATQDTAQQPQSTSAPSQPQQEQESAPTQENSLLESPAPQTPSDELLEEQLYKKLALAQVANPNGTPEERALGQAVLESDLALAYAFAMRAQDTVESKDLQRLLLAKLSTLVQSGNGGALHSMAKDEFNFVMRTALQRF